MLEAFIEDRERRGVAEKTLRWYRWAVQTWLDFGGNADNYTDFLARYEKPATKKAMWSAVRCYERWRSGVLNQEDWTKGLVIRVAPVPETRPLEHREVVRILQQLDGREYRQARDRCFIALLYYTGARRDAIRLLRRRDLDLNARLLHVRTKGKVEGDIALPGPAVEELERWLPRVPGEVLFPSTRDPGRPIAESWITHLVPKLAEAAGITRRVWVHQLRHSCATELVNRGVPLEVVQRQLLHRSQASTLRYARVSSKRVVEAVEGAWKEE